MPRRYHVLDVFTDKALSGNPLAIVEDSECLDDAAMQRIAAEFNLSETVFLLPPRDPVNIARIRIFTPRRELPFAGHPTVGAAILLASLQAPDLLGAGEIGLCLEEPLGPVDCVVRRSPDGVLHARFEAPQQARDWGSRPDGSTIAAELGLADHDVGGFGHEPTRFEAGVEFTFVPVRDLPALGRARMREGASNAAYYLYTPDPDDETGNRVRARMLASGLGITEDPATGAAAVAFAGALLRNEKLADGTHDCVIHQGVEMQRPSRIGLSFTVEGGKITSTAVGGQAVLVAQGSLFF